MSLYKRFIKQNLKIVMVAYNRKSVFEPNLDDNIDHQFKEFQK